MIPSSAAGVLHVNRAIDLSPIDAVGFDLDHTLALYDDHALNLLATLETVGYLAERRGYPREILPTSPRRLPAARGLSLDLRHGNVIKIGAEGRVRLARRGEHFLDADDVQALYGGHDPADERETWHIHSPFDEPTLWFFSAMAHRAGESARFGAGRPAAMLADIRAMLDESHTRGELKHHVRRELDRFVSPAARLPEAMRAWTDAGKRLFLVTNSERSFASAVLDAVIGPEWASLFSVVVFDAGKPGFFARDAAGEVAIPGGAGGAVVLERSGARAVEARLGVAAGRVLYVGDNSRSDVAPARAHGWRTVHVVAELGATVPVPPWGHALVHEGHPTWFAGAIRAHADLVCDRVDSLLRADPRGRLEPAGSGPDRGPAREAP